MSRAKAGEVVLLAEQCLRAGAVDQALSVCETASRLGLSDPGIALVEATCRAARGDRATAGAIIDRILAESPDHVVALHHKAHLLVDLGDKAGARAVFGRVIDSYPDFPGAHGALAALTMPGPPYRDVLARVHQLLAPKHYLEIGVERGSTLTLATSAVVAAGVDPADLPMDYPLPRGARLFRATSDAFFASETRETVFDGHAPDLVFIDGMHWFEFALRDFVHVERWAAPTSVVIFHDCLPVTKVAARRERASNFWVGDVWKALDCLLEYRRDLRIRVVPTRPSGLVFVSGLDPRSRMLETHMDEILARYAEASEPTDPALWSKKYPMVENNELGLRDALGR